MQADTILVGTRNSRMTWSQPGVREAFVLSWVSLLLTVAAFVVGCAVAAVTSSSATLGFALENAVDFLSSALVCWRFYGGGKSVPEAKLEEREKRASVGIALSFVVLALGTSHCPHCPQSCSVCLTRNFT